MAYGSHSSVPDTPRRMAIRLVPHSHSRQFARHGTVTHTLLPVIGADDVILPAFDEKLGMFAIRAQQDDREARDALYFAFLPKLTRLMAHVRPPAVPPGAEGVWSRDDVEQEAYLVFLEIVDAWSGDVSFTSFLLSRFPWRLKDVFRRGIGRSAVPPRRFAVSIDTVELIADERDSLADAGAAFESVRERLPDPLADILVAHVMEGKTKSAIARELGVSRRTMVRYWQDIRAHTVAALGEVVPEPCRVDKPEAIRDNARSDPGGTSALQE